MCVQAEEWLNSQAQELGWHKATKLQSRAASQGLVGISCNEHGAALVSVLLPLGTVFFKYLKYN